MPLYCSGDSVLHGRSHLHRPTETMFDQFQKSDNGESINFGTFQLTVFRSYCVTARDLKYHVTRGVQFERIRNRPIWWE